MNIGWCADLREAALLHKLGFDFVEVPLAAFGLDSLASIDAAKAAVAAAPLWLAHIHLADTGRRNPGSGSYDYDRFMGLLKESRYTGAISSECKLENPEREMRHSLAFLRRYWTETAR